MWVAACLEAAIPGTRVRQHDDGSRPSMYDLDILDGEEVVGACEVTAAADAQQIELWNLLNGEGGRHTELGLKGGWSVVVTPTCRVTKLKGALRNLLEDLEARQIKRVGRDEGPDDLEEIALDLGICRMFQSETEFAGSVYFTVDPPRETASGFVPDTGDFLCEWLEAWIATPDQAHNISKLSTSGAPGRHLYIIQAPFAAPFEAADVLMRDGGPLPDRPLEMPDGLTNVWVMSAWSTGDVFAWDRKLAWSRHRKITDIPNRLST